MELETRPPPPHVKAFSCDSNLRVRDHTPDRSRRTCDVSLCVGPRRHEITADRVLAQQLFFGTRWQMAGCGATRWTFSSERRFRRKYRRLHAIYSSNEYRCPIKTSGKPRVALCPSPLLGPRAATTARYSLVNRATWFGTPSSYFQEATMSARSTRSAAFVEGCRLFRFEPNV
jgi:hypothetical protein